MKSVKDDSRIGKHFLNDLGKASPHIHTHFLDLLTQLAGLLLQHFNDILLFMTINHLNQFSTVNIGNNSGEILMSFAFTDLINAQTFNGFPINFFAWETDN